MALIECQDLTAYGVEAQPETIDWAVGKASALVEEAWRYPVEPVPAWVVAITEAVALRWFHNPNGVTSFTVALDDASRSERMDEARTRAGFYLTEEEQNRLAGTGPGGSPRRPQVGSIRYSVPRFQ